MAGSNFTVNRIWFDAVAAMDAVQKIVHEKLDECADELAEIMKQEIDRNGNGSHVMKERAKAAVKKELKEMSLDKISIEVGINEEDLSGMSEQFFVSVMVVLHGNQTHGPIWTKPGQLAWGKDVTGPRVYTMRNGQYPKLQPLPFFDQYDVSGYMIANAIQRIRVVFARCLLEAKDAVSGNFFAQFMHVG